MLRITTGVALQIETAKRRIEMTPVFSELAEAPSCLASDHSSDLHEPQLLRAANVQVRAGYLHAVEQLC